MYIKITKNQAIKALKEGQTVFMLANKLSPKSAWITPCPLTLDDIKQQADFRESFEDTLRRITNSFEYYSCTRETGNKISWYTK